MRKHPKLGRIGARRPSPAMVVAITALVVACGGTATAASVLVKSSAQIKNGAVTGDDVKNASLTSVDVRNKSLKGADLVDGTVGATQLTKGVKDSLAATGSSAIEVYRGSGPQNVQPDGFARVATMKNVPPGVYVVTAKTIVADANPNDNLLQIGNTVGATCQLDADGAQDQAIGLIAATNATTPTTLHMQVTRTIGEPSDFKLDCRSDQAWKASNTSIVAIKVGRAPSTAVDG